MLKNNSLLTVLLLCCTLHLSAQEVDNLLSKNEYMQIKIQNTSIQQLYDFKGSKEKIIAVFGTPTSQDTTYFSYTLKYGNNHIGVNKDDKRITGLRINDTSWSITIKGTTFKVGDPVSKFQQVFGSTLKVIVSSNNPNRKFIGFSFAGNDFDSITIYIDPNTNKVKRIVYFVIP